MTSAATSVRAESASTGQSAFAQMQARLAVLGAAFGLVREAPEMLATYRAIFRHALAFPLGSRPPGTSRLTEDGTPIQFATTVAAGRPGLRFVGDAGPPGASGAERMRTARAAMAEAAEILGLSSELATLTPFLDELAPQTDRALMNDPAGSYWIGAAFAPGAAPLLRLYLNGGWGGQAAVSARLRTFAAHFGQQAAWAEAEHLIPAALAPLGLAFTLLPGRPARGAIYLRAFGLRLTDYTRLAEAIAGPANAAELHAFGTALLGSDSSHPTPSAVFSIGFSDAPRLSAELEFCTHCLYRDDAEACHRLLALFTAAGLDPTPYLTLLRQLSPGARPGSPPRLHSFVGVDAKATGPAYTLYLKPDFATSG
ncbi:MAG: hypothetical protein WCC57_12620 [Paracoccaceae bacterium]